MNSSAVTVTGLSVRLGEYLALDNLNLSIPQGSFVAIVGPNGAGKSTFLKVILGLLQPCQGTIHLFDRDLSKVPAEWLGYVPQVKMMDRSFPALSIELVLTGLKLKWPWFVNKNSMQKALEALQKVGAGHLARQPIGRLSGGELQRVYFARAIVRQPKLIMLDEPATGIDAIGEYDMYRSLEEYQKEHGSTLLIVTHDWHTATHHADQVLLLNKKQISFGAPSEALAEDNLRLAFGHMGHEHRLLFLVKQNG
jgi:zinc transport system ATP-binding protein